MFNCQRVCGESEVKGETVKRGHTCLQDPAPSTAHTATKTKNWKNLQLKISSETKRKRFEVKGIVQIEKSLCSVILVLT